MSVASNYLCAVTAGVVTAGMTAAVAAVPPETATVHRDVALTQTTIPIVDTDQTFGPLHVIQKQTATFNADIPGQLILGLHDANSTTWTGQQLQAALSVGGDQVLTLFGNAVDGYGAGVTGSASSGGGSLNLTGIGTGAFGGTVGAYTAKLVAIPSEGLVGNLGFTPIAGGGGADFTLGDHSLNGTGGGEVASNAQLCLGSTARCNGVIASVEAHASGNGGFTLTGPGGSKAVSFSSPTGVTAALRPDEFSVTGKVGGTATVGTRTVGRVRDIDIHIPTTSAVTSASSNRPAQGLSGSQPAAGEKVKTAVRAAKHRAQSRHAAAD